MAEDKSYQPRVTYGGEVELLVVNRQSGGLLPVDPIIQEIAQNSVNERILRDDDPVIIGHDSATHLVEIGAGVHNSLVSLIASLKVAIGTLQETLTREKDGALLSLSYHPLEAADVAYQHVVNRPLYELIRGRYGAQSNIHPSVLQKIYLTASKSGRVWKHSLGALAASIQPWNSLTLSNAAQQIAVLQATGWLFNLLTANSPVANGLMQEKRDYRLEIWGNSGILSTSRYKADRDLIKNVPDRPRRLVDYYHFVLTHQRPLVVPLVAHDETASHQYKTRFMAVVQPDDQEDFTVLDYLTAKYIRAVDIETGEEKRIVPSVGHIFNGFDFLYFPQFGSRLRLMLPLADTIDATVFAKTVAERNEGEFQKLLVQGGIHDGGFICAEGRVAATVIPTAYMPTWERFCIPFVLQTALVRRFKEVLEYMDSTPLAWYDFAYHLPSMTNNRMQGFKTVLRQVKAITLAKDIWFIVKKGLEEDELNLVGESIEQMLESQKAPAEEAIEFIYNRYPQSQNMDTAILSLIYCNMGK
jgi:hypothetical protein